jgi:hypothetical protein
MTMHAPLRCTATCILVLLILALFAAKHPVPIAADSESPFCALPPDPAAPWLPVTPLPQETTIPSPRPASDCQFYRPAWQRFLVATQPTNGIPAFVSYPSLNQISGEPLGAAGSLELSERGIQAPNNPNGPVQKLLEATQAGVNGNQGGYLIDQNGRFVYYGIHFNWAFLQFLRNQHLTNVDAIKKMDESQRKSLTFLGDLVNDVPTGINTQVVEYKSAWMIVDKHHPPSNYFVVPARVPHYAVSGGTLVPKGFDDVKLALIALHVVFTLPGHPELIWSTFEHVHLDAKGNTVRDNAPAAHDNPSNSDPSKEVTSDDIPYPLYKAHTLMKDANKPVMDLKTIAQFWDEKTQSFTKGQLIQTSVYRPFPGSKTDGSATNQGHGEDDEVSAVNAHAGTMFADATAKHLIGDDDKRSNYRLVGATWLDQPVTGANASFRWKQRFEMDETQSTDDMGQPIAGEGRLGSTAMESFTEFDGGAPSCFSCHDTQVVLHNNAPLLDPALLNVSHVPSKYVIEKSVQQTKR